LKTILIFAESATLAHVLRAKYVADSLVNNYNIIFACSREYDNYVKGYNYIELKESINTKDFLNNINKNRPIFDFVTLEKQYIENRKLIDKFCPDLVIGDMRLSLLINRLNDKNFKYANLTNSYFNPNLQLYAKKEYPLPYSMYGRNTSKLVFKVFKNYILNKHINPVNKLLHNKIDNFLYFYFLADLILTFDDSYIFKYNSNDNDEYIDYKLYNLGYLDISLDTLNRTPDYEYIYINLGSSLTDFLVSDIIKKCSKIKEYNFVISAPNIESVKYKNIKIIDYGNINFIKNSILNINNSGILSVGQNLIYAKKQLCIPHNFDQHLVFNHFKDKNIVDGLYSDNLSSKRLNAKIDKVINNQIINKNIKNYSMTIQNSNLQDKINKVINNNT